MKINIVKDFLKSQDWKFTQVEGKNILLFGINGKNGDFQCIVDLIEENSQFIFYSIYAANISKNKKYSILELLNALNNKQVIGNFEMGLENGEIRFKTNFVYHNLSLNQEYISELIMANIVTMDENLPNIISTMYGDENIKTIIEDIKSYV